MKPNAIISDIDGTIALLGDRDPYDMDLVEQDICNEKVKELIDFYVQKEYKILLVSGRNESGKDKTITWLECNKVKFDALYMRPYDNFDTGVTIKQWYLENIIMNNYNVLLALEDVTAAAVMYRKHGIDCWLVNTDPFYKDI